jgi:hypothetical protein
VFDLPSMNLDTGLSIWTGVSSPTAWGLYRRIPERAVSGR